MRRPAAVAPLALALSLALGGCLGLSMGTREEAPPVLHPQVSRLQGGVRLQPRHAREPQALARPELVEPGDWIETGRDGKVEVLLPEAAVRAYANTRFQVLYAFEGRRAAAVELRVEAGEVLVRRLGSAPLPIETEGLRVDVGSLATVLVGTRGQTHHAASYEGRAEARNVRVRGQTVVLVGQGQHLTLDDAATVAYLKDAKLPDEWKRWEKPDALTAGLVPPPAPTPAPLGSAPQK